MIPVNLRDIGELGAAERIRANVERFVNETSQCVEQMATRNRNRQIRAAMDEEENFSDDDARMPVLQDGEIDKPEPEGPVQSVCLQGDGEAA